MLNWKKTLPAAALVALIVTGCNPLLKSGLEKIGNAAFGAKTEIDGFLLTPLGKLNIRRIQVADKNAPMTNLFEVGNFSLGISTEQMLYKRVNIETATIDNILLGTPRKTSGALPFKAKKPEPEKPPFDFNKFSKEMELNPDAVAEAFKTAPPQAGKEAERVQKENEQKLAEAKKLLTSLDINKELSALKLDELTNATISSPEDLKKWTELFNKKQAGLKELTDKLNENKTAAETAINEAQNNLAHLQKTAQQDIDNALNALDIGNYDLGAIGKELLGPKINGWIDTGLGYFDLVKKYMPPKKAKTAKTPKETKPKKERLQGTTVVFPNNKTRPRFWIGRLGLSGVSGTGTNELKYSGYVTDIASEQYILNRPTVLKITGAFTQRAQSNLDINVVLDHRKEDSSQDAYEFFLSGYDLSGAQFWDEKTIPLKITGGLGQIKGSVNIVNGELDGEIVFTGKNMRYEKTGGDDLQELAAQAIMSAPELTVSILLAGTLDAPQISLKTNLDSLIKARLEKEVGDQAAKAQAQIKAEYEKIVGDTQKQIESSLKQQETEINAQFAKQQAAFDGEKAKLEAKKKELEDQVNSQIDAAKKQAEDALRNAIPGLKF